MSLFHYDTLTLSFCPSLFFNFHSFSLIRFYVCIFLFFLYPSICFFLSLPSPFLVRVLRI
jgi:hypothetical protein